MSKTRVTVVSAAPADGLVLLARRLQENGLQKFEIAELARMLVGESEKKRDMQYMHGMHLASILSVLRSGLICPDANEEARARHILGQSFFGLSEASRSLGRFFTDSELVRLDQHGICAYSGNIMSVEHAMSEIEKHKETHSMFPLPGFTTEQFLEYVQDLLAPGQAEKILRLQRMELGASAGWKFVRHTELAGSSCKNWNQQCYGAGWPAHLGTVLALMVVTYRTNGKKLFKGRFVRTDTHDNQGSTFAVGWPTSAGIELKGCFSDQGYSDVYAI